MCRRVLVVAALLVAGLPLRAQADVRCDDDRLSELAATYALERVSPTELLERARAEGASYPSLHVIAIDPGDAQARDRWLARLERRGLGPLACGAAATASEELLVAAPAQGAMALAEGRLTVSLAPSFEAPIVYVRRPGGEPRAYPVEGGVARIEPERLAPPVELQLVARGPSGPRPVAELHLGEPASDDMPSDASAISLLRERAGRGPLRPNRLLLGVATAHAERVCESGSVAHSIGPGGDARLRLERAHVEARHVGEVVARAGDEASAWRALVRSPSHRAALGDPRFTDVGVGVASGRGRTCLVTVLASWPRRLAR